MIVGITAFIALLLLILLRVPVGYALSAIGIFGLWYEGGFGFGFNILKTLSYATVSQYSFVIIPMFLLMGTIASESGITRDLYEACYKLFARVRGSLYVITVLASAGFAAISGSTVANAVIFSKIAIPEMIRLKYDRGLSAGCVAAAGTFAALIPPSIAMIIFAILTGQSIGALLMAGVIPGIVTALIYIIGIAVMTRLKPGLAPTIPYTFSAKEKLQASFKVMPALILIIIVLGGIYTGLIFPSAAGSVGVVGALVIALFKRTLSKDKFILALRSAASTSAMLFIIVIGGFLFSRMLTFSGFIHGVTDLIAGTELTVFQFLLIVCVIYGFLGMLLDPTSMLVATLPVLYPIAVSLDINPIWFAVLTVKLIELGCITPPVGLNLFAVLSSTDGQIKSAELIKGVLPFIGLELISLLVLVLFPWLSTWLPSLMVVQ